MDSELIINFFKQNFLKWKKNNYFYKIYFRSFVILKLLISSETLIRLQNLLLIDENMEMERILYLLFFNIYNDWFLFFKYPFE